MNAAAGVPPSTLLDKAATDLSSSTPTQTTSLQALWISFAIIFVSEIGDKTFMIGAVMAMRHARSTIFAASAAALGLMTVLSALLGFALPNLISRRVTQFLAGGLFFVFGIKCLMEASSMTGKEGQEELDEVVKEIGEKEAHLKAEMVEVGSGMSKSSSSDGLLLGKGAASPDSKKKAAFPGSSDSSSLVDGWKNLMYLLFSPVFIQTFVMVFLAEWGDRSQIATIALAGQHGFFWVTIGALAGHLLCTAGAVIGGRLLATKISVRTVTIIGGVLFLLFGFSSLYEVMYGDLVEND